ncbi:NAD(P)-dependent oxidoreductase [Rhodococcus opacus]|nr:NAD(P)-dependent oxidoreductase [Rhodococcus opacus]
MTQQTTIAVLGLGEAGGAFARDLITAGATVRAFDPAVAAPAGAIGCRSEAEAADTADLVLSVNTARAAQVALERGSSAVRSGAVWVDMNTAAPDLKRGLDAYAAKRGIGFADVSIMAPVPGRGLRTPLMTSGRDAHRAADILTRYGASVDVLDAPAGAAAERKLLRSIFYKGMSAAVLEALAAARALDLEEWLTDNIADELTRADGRTINRIVAGTHRHARRRADEIAAAADMLRTLDIDPDIAQATHELLARINSGSSRLAECDIRSV